MDIEQIKCNHYEERSGCPVTKVAAAFQAPESNLVTQILYMADMKRAAKRFYHIPELNMSMQIGGDQIPAQYDWIFNFTPYGGKNNHGPDVSEPKNIPSTAEDFCKVTNGFQKEGIELIIRYLNEKCLNLDSRIDLLKENQGQSLGFLERKMREAHKPTIIDIIDGKHVPEFKEILTWRYQRKAGSVSVEEKNFVEKETGLTLPIYEVNIENRPDWVRYFVPHNKEQPGTIVDSLSSLVLTYMGNKHAQIPKVQELMGWQREHAEEIKRELEQSKRILIEEKEKEEKMRQEIRETSMKKTGIYKAMVIQEQKRTSQTPTEKDIVSPEKKPFDYNQDDEMKKAKVEEIKRKTFIKRKKFE